MGLQQTLKALSDPTRREILNLLKAGKQSAGEISDHFDITAAAISRHLSVLKEADLIWDTRDGKYIFYELNTSVLEEIDGIGKARAKALLAHFGGLGGVKKATAQELCAIRGVTSEIAEKIVAYFSSH